MSLARAAVLATVAVIALTTLVSGPLVGAVDLTTERYDATGLGQGNATVSAVEAPETARLDSGVGAAEFYLKVPDATVTFESITGKPTVSYKISIDELGYSRGTTHFFAESDVGLATLSIAQDSFARSEITAESYDGQLSITLRGNGTKQVLYDEPITVEVDR